MQRTSEGLLPKYLFQLMKDLPIPKCNAPNEWGAMHLGEREYIGESTKVGNSISKSALFMTARVTPWDMIAGFRTRCRALLGTGLNNYWFEN